MLLRGPRPLIDWPTQALVLLGALNLGLIGAFGFDVTRWMFGHWGPTAQLVIGLSAVWQIFRQRWFAGLLDH